MKMAKEVECHGIKLENREKTDHIGEEGISILVFYRKWIYVKKR